VEADLLYARDMFDLNKKVAPQVSHMADKKLVLNKTNSAFFKRNLLLGGLRRVMK